MSETTLSDLVEAMKALAHPGRLRILAMLREGDLCVCQMTAVLGLAASTVSSHLSDLRRAGFVTERKDGKWVHYHVVSTGPLAGVVRQVLRLVADDVQLREDAHVVERLREVPLDDLCRAGLDLKSVGIGAVRAATRRGRP
jgi:DNA-binding transcriptional ArsR family regulator